MLIKMYVNLINKGLWTIERVPSQLKELVQGELDNQSLE